MKKTGKIISVCSVALISAALIVGDVFAGYYRSIISTFFGCTEQIEGDKTQVEEGAKSGDEVVRKIANEGVVLLKNEKNKSGKPTLPLAKNNRKINVFGWGATDAGFLLAGNGSGKSVSHEENKVTLLDAFKASGFEYNEEIIGIYEKHCNNPKDWGETADWSYRFKTELKEPVTDVAFPSEVVNRAKDFSDTALVILSRYSGEYLERIAMTQKKQGLPEDTTRSFSEITTEEETLLKMCTENFENVIVVFNSGSIMDMSFLRQEEKVGKIGAALNVGYVGQSGSTGIVKILTGEVCPSGKLADTVVYDPKVNEMVRINGRDDKSSDIVYAEDIYVGYKWYETAAHEGYFSYEDVVQYPFGFGLSYTSFAWEIESLSLPENSALSKDSEIEIQVRVTNTGEVAGKDVVELYYTAPYTKGGIEKAYVNLLDFAKTPLLEPEQSSVVTFKFTPYEMASYDCYNLNANGLTGWELDTGDYELKLMTSAHDLKQMDHNTIVYKVEDTGHPETDIIRYNRDPVTNTRIKNRFTGETAYGGLPLDGSGLKAQDGEDWTYLSRSDISNTVPKERSKSPSGNSISKYVGYQYDGYYYDAMPVVGQENNLRLVTKDDGSHVSKDEFDGSKTGDFTLKYNDELIFDLVENFESETWEKLLNQLTTDELKDLIEGSGYKTQAVESIGKPVYLNYDGPSGFNRTNMSPNVPGSRMTAFPAENLVAQTWNKELAYQMGQIVGIDGNNFGIGGIYAPTVNLHREMLNGRNYECYSEDPIISGYMAAHFIKGAASNNVYCYLKHLALYDSAPYTNIRVWITEQNFRENYLKPFEIAIKVGKANGIMASFNKIGPTWAGSNHAMINDIIRGEFGFKGTVITDYSDGTNSVMDIHSGLRGGLNTELNPNYPTTGTYGKVDFNDVTEVNLARESAKGIIYTSCSTYYYAKHNTDSNEYTVEIMGPRAIKKGFEWWIPVLVASEAVIFGAMGFWLYMAFRKKKLVPEGADGKINQRRMRPLRRYDAVKKDIENLNQRITDLENWIKNNLNK